MQHRYWAGFKPRMLRLHGTRLYLVTTMMPYYPALNQNQSFLTHPAIVWVVCKPAHHSLQDMLLVPHVELLHGKELTQPVRRQLPVLLGHRHVPEVRLEVLSGGVVDMVEAVVQGEESDADAVLCGDAALQELAAEGLEVSHEEQVRGLDHVLNGVLAQTDLEGAQETLLDILRLFIVVLCGSVG